MKDYLNEKLIVMMLLLHKSNNNKMRILYLVVMLVAIRLYIRECIIPFDIVYAEEAIKGEDQTEETNGGTGGHKALVISGVIVIIILSIKTYQLNSELTDIKSELSEITVTLENKDEKIKSAFDKITSRINLTTSHIIKINSRINVHSSGIAQTIDEVTKLKEQ